MADLRKERLALNETLFRTANERMQEWEERHEREGPELYYCECAQAECKQKVGMGLEDYERVRSDPSHFFVVPGHEIPDVETVIEEHDGWVLIEKAPGTEAIVEATDRRRD